MRKAYDSKRCKKGFSLIEMGIVLLIVSILASMGISAFNQKDYSKKDKETERRMDIIEKALEDFIAINHRLPCPSPAIVAPGAVGYGYESSNPGNCMDGISPYIATASNGNIVTGSVPVRSLNIADENMLDGWERRFTYTVDSRATAPVALINIGPTNPRAGSITVKDASGTARTQNAVYVLMSHGINGHGAYLLSGARRNAKTTNTAEQENAYHSATAPTSFTGVYNQRRRVESTDIFNVFDDIVRYRERWRISTAAETDSSDVARDTGIPQLLMSRVTGSAPFIQPFFMTPAALQPDTSVAPLIPSAEAPVNGVWGMALSPDNRALAVCETSSGGMKYYTWGSGGFRLQTISGTTPSGTNCKPKWSSDGKFLAVAVEGATPVAMLYERATGTNQLTYLNPASSQGFMGYAGVTNAYDVAWHPNGKYVVFAGGGNANYILYRQNLTDSKRFDNVAANLTQANSQFCTIQGTCTPPGSCTNQCDNDTTTSSGQGPVARVTRAVDWSANGRLVAFGIDSPSSSNTFSSVVIVEFNESGPVYLIENFRSSISTLETGRAVNFSPDGRYFIEGIDNYGTTWRLYEWDSATSRYAYRAIGSGAGATYNCGVGAVYTAVFSPDSQFIAMSGSSQNNFMVAKVDGLNDRLICYFSPTPASNQTFRASVWKNK